MRVKTSITLSEDVLADVDRLSARYGSRSGLIELAVRQFVVALARQNRDAHDVEIINRCADRLNEEAADALAYQAES